MINNLIQTWFDFVCQEVSDTANACLFISDESARSLMLAKTTSQEFSQSKYVHDNIQAVVMRRKTVVTTIAANAIDKESATINDKSATVTEINAKNYLIAAPLIIEKQLVGAVCFEFKYKQQSQSGNYLEKVDSAISWLEFMSKSGSGNGSENARLALKITASALSQSESSEAAMAVASELACGLNCKQVNIGFIKNDKICLHTISNTTYQENQQNIIKCIESAMQEAIDQRETLVFPSDVDRFHSTHEHHVLAKQFSAENVCTVPLIVDETVIGAVMFERRKEAGAFDKQTMELCEQLAGLFAPVLYYRRLNDRPVTDKVKESTQKMMKNLFGAAYPGAKSIIAVLACILMLAIFVSWEYKISAQAILEGEIEMVVTSPESGFIKDATVRPGDLVKMGDVLATLDDRDLQLEKLKWSGKFEQVSREYREALADHNLSQIGILRAQLSQAEAQLEMLELKLNRTVIAAPISAVVVSGDYTRALGSPVERGQVMYRVSPLDNYRVVLQVDESEISEVNVGMRGKLTLSAAADRELDMEVVKITPVSIAENGINYFQVEAKLDQVPEFLRPGMQGVGKIEAGNRQLLWIWTHNMVDWLRLKLWSWW